MKKSDQVCPLYRAGAVSIQLALLGLIAAPAANAATVSLTSTDTIGTTSMDQDGVNNWSDGLDPSAGNDYVVNVEWLRTPGSGDLVFAGDSLTVQADGGIINKNGGAQTLTANLILDGGLVRSGSGSTDTFTLDGTLDVTANNGALVPDQSPYIINSDITGAGTLYLLNDASAYGFSSASGPGQGIDIAGAGTMSGNVVADASDMVWTDTSSWLFTIGASGTNNSITGSGNATFNGVFNFDLTGASSTPGDSWTILDITTTAFGETFSVSTAGFAQSGSVWTDGTYTFNPLSGILAVAEPPTEWFVDGDGSWSTAANWSTGTVPAAGSDVLLGSIITENRTVTLDTNVSLNSLVLSNPINTGDYFIVADTNQTLTLTGEGKIDVAGRHWINAELVTSVGLNVMGGGELVLDADNSISGGLNVDGSSVSILNTDAISAGNDIAVTNNGQVQFWGADNGFFSDNGATGYGTGTVDGNVSLDAGSAIRVNDGADVTFTGIISGDGSVSSSNGTVGFSTAHTYGGTTTLSGTASMTLSGAATLGAADGTAATRTIINDTAQLVLDNVSLGDEYIVLGERASDAIASISSAGTNTIAGNIHADTPGEGSHYIIESTSGTLTLSGTLSSYDGAAPNDRYFVFGGDGNINLTGKITDLLVDENGDPTVDLLSDGNNVHVVKRGSGTMTIGTSTSNANDFWRGTAVVEEGTLKVQAGASNVGELFSSTIDVRAGAVFDTSTFANYSLQVTEDPDGTAFNGDEIGQLVTGAGTINTGSGTMSAYEDASFAPGDSGVGTLTITGSLSFTPTVLNPNGGLNYDLSGSAAGTNDLLNVSGLVTLGASGGGMYNLNVTAVDGALDTAAYTLINGGSGSGSVSTGNFNVAIFNESGTQLNTRQDDSVSVTFSGGDLKVQFAAAESVVWTGATNSTWDVGTTANWSSSDSLYFDLDSVTFNNAGTVDIAAAVTPGGMNIASGTTTLTGAGVEGSGDVAIGASATLVLANADSAITGDVTLASGAKLQAGNGSSTGANVISGSVSGAGSVTVQSGTLVLEGDNSYTGVTTINGGNLDFTQGSGLGSVAAGTVVNAGGSLRTFGQTVTTNEAITLNGGTIRVGGGGPAAATFAGNVTVGAGGATITADADTGDDGLAFTGNIAGSSNGVLNTNIGSGSTMSVSGNLSNNGVLTKTGTGTLALTGTATVAAPMIDIQAGTLDVSGLNSTFTVASGQTLNNDSSNTVVGDVIAGNGSTVSGHGTFANTVTAQSGALIQVGAAGMPIINSASGKLDDFDSYATGDTTTATGGAWVAESAGTANSNIVTSDQGQSLETLGGAAWRGAEYDLTGTDASVLVNETQTFFWQVQASSTGGAYDFMMGLSPSVDNIDATNAWQDFSVMPFINNAAETPYINAEAPTSPWWALMSPDTWTNVWVVVDNDETDPTFDLYYSTGSEEPVLVAADANWRNFAVGQDLNAIGFMAAGGEGSSFLVDNIWYSAGENTTNPLVNPWAEASSEYDPETMTVSGDMVLDAGSILALDIATNGINDLLNVVGELTAAGTLDVALDGAATLAEGDVFDILDFGSITGAFDAINLPTLTGSLEWDTSNLLVDGVIQVIASALLDGDLNGDGFVGLADLDIVLTSWNQNVTAGEWSLGDPSGDGFVGLDDLDFVLVNWNNGTPPSSGSAVPEPASLVLLGLGGMALLKRRSA